MPRGIPNTRTEPVAISREESFSGDFTEQDDQDNVLDLMSPNVDAMAALVRNIEPEDAALFKFDKETYTDADGHEQTRGRSVDYEKFMQEPVTIVIAKTNNKNDSPIVPIGVNGDIRWLPRGAKLRIQRKFVERLAQVHERTAETKPNPDQSSDLGMVTRTQQAQPYPFHVLHDPNPKGALWLRRVTRQGS